MATRWIISVAIGLALSSCSDGGFKGPSRQFSGIWLHEFEGSTFVEGKAEVPNVRPSYGETDWLEWTEWPRLESLMKETFKEENRGDRECPTVEPFLVTFVGHRTHYLIGGAGHWRLWRSKVTVHRPISAERLSPPFCYDH